MCLAMALCQFTDDFVFSFPLTFVPQQLEILDYSSAHISAMVGAFAWANQASFLVLTLMLCSEHTSPRRQLRYLLGATFVHFVTILTMAMFPCFEVITAGRFLQGAVSPLVAVYGVTVAVASVPDGSRALAIAVVLAANTGGELAGSFAGGSLFVVGGLRCPFYFAAALAGVTYVAVGLARMLEEFGPQPAPSRSAGLWRLLADPFVFALCLVVLASQALKTALEVVLPLFLQNQLGADELAVSWFSLTFAVSFTVASCVCGYAAPSVGLARIPGWCLLMAGAAVLTVSTLSVQPTALGLILFGAGLGGTLSPSCDALLRYCQTRLPGHSEAVVVAVWSDFWAAGLVIGSFLAGIPSEFDRLGQRNMLAATGVFVAVSAGVMARRLPAEK